VQIANKYMKKCLTFLAIKTIQSKMTLRFYLTPIKMAITKKYKQQVLVNMEGKWVTFLYWLWNSPEPQGRLGFMATEGGHFLTMTPWRTGHSHLLHPCSSPGAQPWVLAIAGSRSPTVTSDV
jgi:hypothetical protein